MQRTPSHRLESPRGVSTLASTFTLLLTALVAIIAFTTTPPRAAAQAPPDAGVMNLRVMSLNIRVDVDRGANRWELRRDKVVKVIDDFDPDVLGLQEDRPHQDKYLLDKLSRYAAYARAASPKGAAASEHNAILYRADRFAELRAGTFWLSETPDVPGSRSWAPNIRTVNWVELADLANPGLTFVVMNTHWQHTAKGAKARLESAALTRRKLAEIAPGLPVILLGDFNADQGSAPYDRMTGRAVDDFGPAEDERFLIDTYRNRHPEDADQVGTGHRFTGKAGSGRIDWILHHSAFQTLEAAIVRTGFDGRYPSDHFPITAVLQPLYGPR